MILFRSAAPPELPANLARLRRIATGGLPLLVMTDEEDGEVQRMANMVRSRAWPRTMAATMTVGQVRTLAEQLGRRMRAVGVTMDPAPVLDLSDGPGPDAADPDGPRSFSVHSPIATAYGLAFAGLARRRRHPGGEAFPQVGPSQLQL